MDILLIGTEQGMQLRPASVEGMLWLQTHFENDHWDALAAGDVVLPKSDADEMSVDAKKSGLNLSRLAGLCIPSHF